MAAVMNVIKRTLSISILRGQDVDGNPVTKSYTYSNVKPDVEPEKLLAVGKALGGLHLQQRETGRGTGKTAGGRQSPGRSVR